MKSSKSFIATVFVIFNFSLSFPRAISMGLLRKNPLERISTNNLVLDPFLKPKVQNFPQQYRPKYLEERIRRSHVKQLEQQIEMIFMNTQYRLDRRDSKNKNGLDSNTPSKPGTGHGHRASNPAIPPVVQQPSTVMSNSPSVGDSAPKDGYQSQDSPLSLDILPTVLEHLGSFSTSEKVVVNHTSFIIDDEHILQTLNAQQIASIAEAQENGNLLDSYDEDGELISPQISPIKQAKADINIVDGVFGNEKFITIDVKITAKGDGDGDSEKGTPNHANDPLNKHVNNNMQVLTEETPSSESGHTSKTPLSRRSLDKSQIPKPVLEYRYTTEIKLPAGTLHPEALLHGHGIHGPAHGAAASSHHGTPNNHLRGSLSVAHSNTNLPLPNPVNEGSTTFTNGENHLPFAQDGSDKLPDSLQMSLQQHIDQEIQKRIQSAMNGSGTPSKSKQNVNDNNENNNENGEANNERDQDLQSFALVRQASTSIINGHILTSTVEEHFTHLNKINMEELQMHQFQRISDSIESVCAHTTFEDLRMSQKMSGKHMFQSMKSPGNSIHSQSSKHNQNKIDENSTMELPPSNFEDLNEQKQQKVAARPMSGGRIGRQIADAIESDQQYETQMEEKNESKRDQIQPNA
jgi:hypothetical protein